MRNSNKPNAIFMTLSKTEFFCLNNICKLSTDSYYNLSLSSVHTATIIERCFLFMRRSLVIRRLTGIFYDLTLRALFIKIQYSYFIKSLVSVLLLLTFQNTFNNFL